MLNENIKINKIDTRSDAESSEVKFLNAVILLMTNGREDPHFVLGKRAPTAKPYRPQPRGKGGFSSGHPAYSRKRFWEPQNPEKNYLLTSKFCKKIYIVEFSGQTFCQCFLKISFYHVHIWLFVRLEFNFKSQMAKYCKFVWTSSPVVTIVIFRFG